VQYRTVEVARDAQGEQAVDWPHSLIHRRSPWKSLVKPVL
jgi:hypothetical protein